MDKIQELVAILKERGLTVSTAESCTGGLLGKSITDVSGASAVYPGGVISYCNRVKHEILGVDQEILDTLGAVSAPVARQMAEGVRRVLRSDLGVGVTGIAGAWSISARPQPRASSSGNTALRETATRFGASRRRPPPPCCWSFWVKRFKQFKSGRESIVCAVNWNAGCRPPFLRSG